MSCSTRFVFPFGLKLQKYLLFCEIKFLICIPEINSVKFAIFKTQFAKVSSLEIFSHQNIFFWGIINLTNGKGSHAQKRSMLKNAFSVVYSLLKIKSKAYILENIFTILSGRINHVGKKVPMWYNDFAFHVSNRVDIYRMPTWFRKTDINLENLLPVYFWVWT